MGDRRGYINENREFWQHLGIVIARSSIDSVESKREREERRANQNRSMKMGLGSRKCLVSRIRLISSLFPIHYLHFLHKPFLLLSSYRRVFVLGTIMAQQRWKLTDHGACDKMTLWSKLCAKWFGS